MAEYGSFSIADDPVGEGGKALNANFITAADTLSALGGTISAINNVASSLSADIVQISDTVGSLSSSISSHSASISSLSVAAQSISANAGLLSSSLSSISDMQHSLSLFAGSIAVRTLQPKAIVASGGSEYKALRGDDHGVIASGSDAATVINAAIDYVKASGGLLYICAGIYPINSTLNCQDAAYPVVIQGSGPATILRCNVASASPVLSISGCNNISIVDLLVDGNKLNISPSSTTVGISISDCNDVDVKSCQVICVPGIGMRVSGGQSYATTNVNVTNCRFYGMYGSGLYIDCTTRQLTVAKCVFENNCSRADLFAGSGDLYIAPQSGESSASRCIVANNVFFGSGSTWLGNQWNKRQLFLLCGNSLSEDVDIAHASLMLYDTSGRYTASSSSFRFTTIDGITPLKFRRKHHSSWGGGVNVIADYAIQIPKFYRGDIIPIYMYWDAQDVSDASTDYLWGDDYAGVWHMWIPSGTTIPDLSPYGRNATKKSTNEPQSYVLYPIVGQQFDGNDDYVNTGVIDACGELTFVTKLRMLAWQTGMIWNYTDGGMGYMQLLAIASGQTLKFTFAAMLRKGSSYVPTSVETGYSYTKNVNYTIVCRIYNTTCSGGRNGVVMDITINGSRVASVTRCDATDDYTIYCPNNMLLRIGASTGSALNGVIDEVVMYKGKMSASRMLAEASRWSKPEITYAIVENSAIEKRGLNIGNGNRRNTAAVLIYDVNGEPTSPTVTISNNIIAGMGGCGIKLVNSSRVTISSNAISNVANSGICLEDCKDVIVSSNILNRCAVDGFYMPSAIAVVKTSQSSGCVIDGNQVIDSGNYGIFVNSTRCIVGNNNIDGNCWTGELSASITSVGSDTVTLSVTGLPSGITAQSLNLFPSGKSAHLVYYDNNGWQRKTGFTVSSCTDNTVVLSGVVTGLSSGMDVWLSLTDRSASLLVADRYAFVHHNIVRTPVQPAVYCMHISNWFNPSTTGDYLKFADNDLFVGAGAEQTLGSYAYIVGSNNTIVNNRGYTSSSSS